MRPPLEFFAAGIPKAQPRTKARACGKFAQVYTPKTADDWKMIVRHEAMEAWKMSGNHATWTGPIRVDMVFYFPRPKGHYRGNGQLKPSAPRWHTTKPDCDNCCKAVLDALTNARLWTDDKQVCISVVEKHYANSHPGCRVNVREVGD